MTAPDPFPPPVSDEPPPPFESALTIEIDKPVNLEQLTDEIHKALKTDAGVAMSGPINGNEAISPDNKATLSITPANASKTKVQKAIDDHVPNAQFGVPQTEQDFAAALAKVVNDPAATLTAAELQAAVKGLMMRVPVTPAPVERPGPPRSGLLGPE